MIYKDLKRFSLLISSSLTATIEAGINPLSQPWLRQILSPLSVLASFCIATLFIFKIKGYSQNILIKNREEEIVAFSLELKSCTVAKDKALLSDKIEICRRDIVKFKREKSKIDFF